MVLVDPLADVFDLSRVSCGVMAQLIAYEPWGVTIDPVPGAAFHAVVAGGWLITIAFITYALASSAVPKDKRGLWAAVLFLGNMLTLPFFWFWYIWRPSASSANRGT